MCFMKSKMLSYVLKQTADIGCRGLRFYGILIKTASCFPNHHKKITCRQLGIHQIYSRVKTPTDRPSVERFNRTVQEEWLAISEVGLDDIPEANTDLTNWLVTYNNLRPHQSLDYLTPLEYAVQKYQVSPMWASSTNT